jgi:signal transduction histidine kinase
LGARTAKAILENKERDMGDQLDESIEYVLTMAEAGLAEMRALIFELRPDSLEKEGLIAALEKQAAALQARHALHVTTEFYSEPVISVDEKQALFRIVQEALHNVVKHARANRVRISLEAKENGHVLEVEDDGVGFDPAVASSGLGLYSMRERIERYGGELEIKSNVGNGTLIRVKLPFGD